MYTKYYWHIPVLLLLAAALFTANLGGYDLWPPDEPRFAEVAREMMMSGDYLAPHVNGLPYHEKPPLLFWAIAAVSAPWGDVDETTARIPSVMAALVTVACAYYLARRRYDVRTAWWTALVLMTGLRFAWQARTGQIDMLLTGCLTAGWLAFDVWQTDRRARYLVAFYACSALGMYAKGPAGLIFPLLFIFTYTWRNHAERRRTHWVIGSLAVIALTAAWYIPARLSVASGNQAAAEGMASNLFFQTIGRFFLGVSKAQPPWYYLETLPVDWLPWTLLLPWTVAWVWRNRKEDPNLRFALCWIVPAFLFFSISSGKRAIYLLPIFPAMALVIARSLIALIDSGRAVWRQRTEAVWALALLGLGLVPLGALNTSYAPELPRATMLAVSAALLAMAGHAALSAWRKDGRGLGWHFVLHAAILILLTAKLLFPVVNQFKSARDFCAPLRTLALAGAEYQLYSAGFTREEYVFYAHRFHEPLLIGIPPADYPNMPQDALEATYRALDATVQSAVDKVPVARPGMARNVELATLEMAVNTVLASVENPLFAQAYRAGNTKVLNKLAEALDSDKPVFVFAREDHWAKFEALLGHRLHGKPIRQEQVGRRRVLLMANDAGLALCHAHEVNPAQRPSSS